MRRYGSGGCESWSRFLCLHIGITWPRKSQKGQAHTYIITPEKPAVSITLHPTFHLVRLSVEPRTVVASHQPLGQGRSSTWALEGFRGKDLRGRSGRNAGRLSRWWSCGWFGWLRWRLRWFGWRCCRACSGRDARGAQRTHSDLVSLWACSRASNSTPSNSKLNHFGSIFVINSFLKLFSGIFQQIPSCRETEPRVHWAGRASAWCGCWSLGVASQYFGHEGKTSWAVGSATMFHASQRKNWTATGVAALMAFGQVGSNWRCQKFEQIHPRNSTVFSPCFWDRLKPPNRHKQT